jgi:metallophosphoesterase superfamily enzyme
MQLFKRGNAWLTAEQLIEYNKNNSVVILGDKKINETEEEYDIEEEDTEELEEVGEVEEEKNKTNKSKKK